ncbi:MAG: oligosaccharide flippase family protein, partial [Lentisphaerae bacterium]|nr:oligosaccharide flippase family protein [Lentisphaerota bacterium]
MRFGSGAGSVGEFVRGSVVRLFFRGVGTGLSLAFYLLVSRGCGAAAAGVYALTMTVLNIGVLLTMAGTQESAVRFIAEAASLGSRGAVRGTYRRLLKMNLAAAFLLAALLACGARLIAGYVFREPGMDAALRVAAGVLPFQCVMTLNGQALRGLKRIAHFTLVRNVLPPALGAAILGVLLAVRGASLKLPVYAYA